MDCNGALKIDTGRLTGTGVAVASQGAAFPYNGSRFRFRCRFSDSNQELAVAFDAAKDGSGGVRVEVDGFGRLSLFEGPTRVVYADVPPLETGVDWFVEARFQGSGATAVLSRNNYASEVGASLQTTIKTEALKVTVAGTRTAATLAANGISPALDEVSLARCGVKPPKYTALFVDTFERADSTTLGSAELPASATWTSSGAEAKIVDGGLQVTSLATAHIPLATVPTNGLRVRVTIKAVSDFLWANVNYNASGKQGSPQASSGFWVWNDKTAVVTGIFPPANSEIQHTGKNLTSKTSYFVELNRDDSIANLTIREGSFAGPIRVVRDQLVTAPTDVGQFLWLGTTSGIQTTFFDDIRVDAYEVQ